MIVVIHQTKLIGPCKDFNLKSLLRGECTLSLCYVHQPMEAKEFVTFIVISWSAFYFIISVKDMQIHTSQVLTNTKYA